MGEVVDLAAERAKREREELGEVLAVAVVIGVAAYLLAEHVLPALRNPIVTK
jgi:hypothetical protein